MARATQYRGTARGSDHASPQIARLGRTREPQDVHVMVVDEKNVPRWQCGYRQRAQTKLVAPGKMTRGAGPAIAAKRLAREERAALQDRRSIGQNDAFPAAVMR